MNNQRFRQKRKQTRAKKLSPLPCSPPIINHYLPPHAYANNIRQAVVLAAIAPPRRTAVVEQVFEGVGLHLRFGLGCDAANGSVRQGGDGLTIACYCGVAIAVTVGGGYRNAGEPEKRSYIISSSFCAYNISRSIAISSWDIKQTCQTASVNYKINAGTNVSGCKTIASISTTTTV